MLRDFLCDVLDMLDDTASPATIERLCARMRKLYDEEDHSWIPDFIHDVIREHTIGNAVRKAILESQRDSIQAKIDAIYRQAQEREGDNANPT